MKKCLSLLLTVMLVCTLLPAMVWANPEPDLRDGLVLHNSFESDTIADGLVQDLSGNGLHGQLVGNPAFVPGVNGQGQAISFDNGDLAGGDNTEGTQYVNYGAETPFMAGDFSVSLWLKTVGGGQENAAIISNKDYASGANPGFAVGNFNNASQQDVRLNINTVDVDGENQPLRSDINRIPANDDAWHHLVAVFDRTNNLMKVYLDAELFAELDISRHAGNTLETGLDLVLGASGKKCNALSNAFVDELRIYAKALNASDTLALYEDVLPPVLPTVRELLQQLYDEVKNYNAADYTEESWALFAEARLGAAAVLSDDGSSDETLQQTYDLLLEAKNTLETVGGIRFGVISDTHLTASKTVEQQRLKKAFEFFSDEEKGVDALAVVGDLSDSGTASELNTWKNIKDESLRLPLIASMGNHEYDQATNFVNATGNKPTDCQVINGYYFITLSPGSGSFNEETGLATTHGGGNYAYLVSWLEGKLAEAEAASPDKPIFVFFHHPIRNTFYVSHEWYGSGLDTVFRNHPRAVTFSGHIHTPNNTPLSIWQDGGFTAVNTASLSYMELETGMVYGSIPPNSNQFAQGMMIEANGSDVIIRNYDFISDQWIDQTWQFDVTEELPYTTEKRRQNAVAPHFEENADITVSDIGMDNATIAFDQATLAENLAGDIVHSYRYDFVNQTTGTVDRTFKTWSEFYFLPMPSTIQQVANGLQAETEYEVRIYGIDAFGLVSTDYLATTFSTLEDPSNVPPTFEEMREGVPMADLLDVDFSGGVAADLSPRQHQLSGSNGSNIAVDDVLGKPVANFSRQASETWRVPWSSEDYAKINDGMTIEATVKLDPFSGSYINTFSNMQSAGAGFEIYPGSDGKADLSIWMHIGGSYKIARANGVMNYGEWHHTLATYDGKEVALYLNGAKVASVFAGGTISTPGSSSQYYVIGADCSSGGVEAIMAGALSTARIYSEPLTPKQVRMLANRELPMLDKIDPVIRLLGEPAHTGTVGETVVVPAAQAADNSSRVTLSVATADPDGLPVTIEGLATEWSADTNEGSFVPAKAGNYLLTYTAIDKAGNETQIDYLIEVAAGTVDKTALQALYNECLVVENDNYTEDSWGAFQNALTAAEAVLENESATQQQVDDAKEQLQTAYNGLAKQPGPGDVGVESVKINLGALTNLKRGKPLQLDVSINPENATDKTLMFTSSNNNVLTVNANGVVTGVKPGTARVTATAHNGTSHTVTIRVTA